MVVDPTCRRHRTALLDFVDSRAIGPMTGNALDHLERCGRCVDEFESILVAVTALRRIGDEVADADAPADAWPRLRVRILRWQIRRPLFASPLAGMALGLALVAAVAVPAQLRSHGADETTRVWVVQGLVQRRDQRIELAYGAIRRQPATIVETIEPGPGKYPRIYPDGIRPTQKEVSPDDSTGRPAQPS
jgi:hypothetical protein